jgi:diguanylate cyclase
MAVVRALGRRGRVFAVLAAVAPVPFLVGGTFLAHAYQHQAEDRSIAQGVGQATVVAQLLSNEVTFKDPGRHNGLEPAETQRLDTFAEAQIGKGTFLRLTVINPDRTVLYSSDPSGENEALGENPDTVRALAGRAGGHLVTADAGGATTAGGDRQVLSVSAPLHDPNTQAELGIVEVRLALEPIPLAVLLDRDRAAVIAAVIGLGVVHLALVRRVSRAFVQARARAAQAEHRATHDQLTGLPNLARLQERFEEALSTEGADGSGAAIVLIDLNRFQEINDALGHQNGDLLLIELAGRLSTGLREQDLVVRLGGDTFALLLPGVRERAQIESTLARVRAAIEAELTLEGLPLHVEASLGVAFGPSDGTETAVLLRRADVAMHSAKRTRTAVVYYESQQDKHDTDRLALISDLRRAIDRDELVLHFQPQVHQRDGRVHCLEALVRWQHPTRGLLGPDLFVPIAEQTGLIDGLTEWVLHRALTELRRWRITRPYLSVAVNVSARSLHDFTFPQTVQDALFQIGMDPQWLLLEITETALVTDAARAALVLGHLRLAGLRLSLDDFGQGYTSLSQLSALPFNELKIDKGFVMNMLRNRNDAAIVHLIVNLAHNLGLEVVAEGVENDEILRELVVLGCDITQGYHFSRPLPADQVLTWLTAHDGEPAETEASGGTVLREV